MTVAYLTNQYPATSHSFIRREIVALELLGVTVKRYSIRSTANAHVDPRDAEEATRTTVLLDSSQRVLRDSAYVASRQPIRFARAAKLTGHFAAQSDRGWFRNAAYLAEACALLRCLELEGVQHVHAHFGTNSANVAALCHELGGPPYSFTVHGPEEFDRAPVLGLREKIHGAKFVVAISEYGRSQLCRMVDRSQWDKIHVVRCGLQSDLLQSDVTPVPNVRRFVCVGRLSEQKGHLVLLEAAAKLAARGVEFELTLAGDGPLRAIIEERIEELSLSKRVTITGWLTEQQVMSEIRASAAMVLPSFAEGLPVVIMEAYALGRPVISTFVAGIPELIESGKNGWLVPAGAVEPLVDAMSQVLSSTTDQLEAMGRSGRTAVQERHDVLANARVLRSLIGEAAS